MLWAMTLTLLAPVSFTTSSRNCAQVGLGLLGALAVVVVAHDAAAGGPAVEEGGAVELEVVGHLRGAVERVVEIGVVAVHEHHGLVLEGVAAADALAHQGHELLARQRLQLLDGEVLLGVLGLLVDGDVDVGDADGERALDVGHLVRLRHRHQGAAELEPAGALRRCRRCAWARAACAAVGAVEDRHHVPVGLRLGRHARRRA